MYNSNDQVLLLDSELGFFELFAMRTLKRTDIRIPNTVLCEEGKWKDWLFNSGKDRNHIILRKRKQNLVTFKVVRMCCDLLGCFDYINDCTCVQQIHKSLQGQIKSRLNQQSKISVTYRGNKTPKSIRIFDLLTTLSNSHYGSNHCPQSWKLVQENIQYNPRHQEYYYVSADRPEGISNYRFSFLKRIVDDQSYPKTDEENIFALPPRRDITKNIESDLTHHHFNLTLKVIEFLQINLKFSVKRIDLKIGINKTRQSFLLSILKIVNRVPFKFLHFAGLKSGGTLNIHEFLQTFQRYRNCASKPDHQKRLMTEQISTGSQTCSGDFCNVLLRNQGHNRPSSALVTEISIDQILRVRKNLKPILGKLKSMNILATQKLPNIQNRDSSDSEDEMNNSMTKYIRRICKKCQFIYGLINKTMEFDSNGLLIDKPRNSVSINTLTVISQDSSLPISRMRQPFKTDKIDVSERKIRQPILPVKNFLRMNIQMLKDGIPSLSTFKKIRADSVPLKHLSNQTYSQSRMKTVSVEKNLKQQSHSIRLNKKFKTQSNDTFMTQQNSPRKKIQTMTTNFNLNTAKAKLMSSIGWVSAFSVSQLKHKYQQCYRGFRNRQEFEVNPIQYLAADQQYSSDRRPIYSFQSYTPLHCQSNKYKVSSRPVINIGKLSEMCGSPQIVLKNDFIIDTLVCDTSTTITFCLLTSEMFGNQKGNHNYENLIIVQDMFDCFLQYLQLAKDLLQNSVNKRIILFNYPGQSYTTFDQNVLYDGLYMCEIVDKILYRLGQELHLINLESDHLKFAGFGYGGYITQLYLSINHNILQNLNKILLLNSFTRLNKDQQKIMKKLHDIYSNKEKISDNHAYLYYNLSINSSHQTNQQIDNKMILNPINISGRLFILRNILRSTSSIRNEFEQVPTPTTLAFSQQNCFVTLHQMNLIAHYSNNPTKKIHSRQLIQVAGVGHDILADGPSELLKIFEEFLLQ